MIVHRSKRRKHKSINVKQQAIKRAVSASPDMKHMQWGSHFAVGRRPFRRRLQKIMKQ